MSQTQEIIARIGADTSGFRRGVDDVAKQSARLKNDMRVAFATGEQGAHNVKRAFKGVMDVAGQSSGPLGQMMGGIKDIFETFRNSPVAGTASAIGLAITLAAKSIEEAADAALAKTREAVTELKKTQGVLRTLFPDIFNKDKLASLRPELATAVSKGDVSTIDARGEEATRDREALRARARNLATRQNELANQLNDARAELRLSQGTTGRPTRGQFERNRAAKARVDALEKESAEVKAQIDRVAEYIPTSDAKLKAIADARAEAVKINAERDEAAKKPKEKPEPTPTEKMAEAESKVRRDIVEANRSLTIKRAETAGMDTTGMRRSFLRSDYLVARETKERAERTGDTEAVLKATLQMVKLTEEAVKLQQEIRQNTKGGARL